MILKCALKYFCFVALVLYGTMTVNIMTWIWKRYKVKINSYDVTTLSELELQKYDVNQISLLRNSVIFGQYDVANTTLTVLGTENKKLTKNRKDEFETLSSRDEKFATVGKISVFSAYYDNRFGLEYPLVRILGLTSIDSTENLVCGFLESVMGPWILAEKYEMCENHGKLYGGYIFNCIIPEHMKVIPTKVYLHSLTSISEQTKVTINKSVALDVISVKQFTFGMDEHKPFEKLRLGVCVSPMYGKINLSNFIQFIELLKIQGINHTMIYKMKITKSSEILLDHYQSKGDITVINWTLPGIVKSDNIWYNGQIIMIQDCLYRMMGNFDYIAFLDLDEAIIPQFHFNWTNLIHHLETKSKTDYPYDNNVGFSFKSAFFDPNRQTTDSQKLSFLKTLHRNEMLSSRRTKVIVKPELIVEMGIHHVSKTISNYYNEEAYAVDPNDGLIHHFKSCTTQLDPTMNCENSKEDYSILKYEKILTKQYNEVLKYNMKYFKTLM